MAKVNRQGKAKIWSKPVIKLLRSRLATPPQRLIFEISLFTGERMGAIVQLKVSDVFEEGGKVRETITFGSASRKSSRHGLASTRQIYIHPHLKVHLENYSCHRGSNFLFPSPRDTTKHITARAVDDYWRRILTEHGYYGYSTHSSRRWVINQLRKTGIEIVTIAETMAIDIATVRKYLDEDPTACKHAIATLTV
jgi:integrase/recombinase XerD